MKEEVEIVKLNMEPVLIIGQGEDDNVVCAIAELPDDPALLGVMLADVVRHAANVYCGVKPSLARAKTVMEIAGAFNQEMSNPSSEAQVITHAGRVQMEGGLTATATGEDDGDN